MVNDNQQYAYFAIEGVFDPDEVTARAGVQPSNCWRLGDICKRTLQERRISRWSLHSRLSQDDELEAHIRDVFAQLDDCGETLAELSREFGGWLQLVAYLHKGYPGLHFDRDITDRLARYSLSVDFDFYWLHSEGAESSQAFPTN
jgi:hypothetical protein